MTIKDLKYLKINCANPLNLIINKVNGYLGKINKSYLLINYFMSVLTNESKEKNKKYDEMWSKIRDLRRSINKSSDDYDEKYMRIKFNSDDKLPLNKVIEIPRMIIVAVALFH